MKKYIGFIAILLSFLIAPSVNAGVNDFYFSDFTGDYYLTKDSEGVSHLKVRESVTAVFPDFKQNKGICRQISFTNQGGVNVTLPNLNKGNLTLTRNGEPEPIYSIEKEGNYYNVCTGTDEYVLGEQTYVFEYEFSKVVTEFNIEGRIFQELYWDTNGNGARQKFESVTARLHFDDIDTWTGESWCYVGKYGEKGSERCEITKKDYGVKFVSKNLAPGENLTFDVELKSGSFVVPEPDKNYILLWVMIAIAVLCALRIYFSVKKVKKVSDKRSYYKGMFVKPEFQPHSTYSLGEMAELYIGDKRDAKVAMLLEMVVKHQISFKKEDKKKWSIIVEKSEQIGPEGTYLLEILNGGGAIKDGMKIELKRRTATSSLVGKKRKMEETIVKDLKKDKLVESKYEFGYSNRSGFSKVVSNAIFTFVAIVVLGIMAVSMLFDTSLFSQNIGGIMMYSKEFYPITLSMIGVTVIIWAILNNEWVKVVMHTKEGLKQSRFMDGLKMYIEMAEAERMKVLQSVKGADKTPEGTVKLYEKLLPYAAVFGLEESWLAEMKNYCEVQEIEEPDYLLAGITAAELSRMMRNTAGYVSTATTMSSSGGGSSSGFSGGGGGGFSGGGGGGGGFSGR